MAPARKTRTPDFAHDGYAAIIVDKEINCDSFLVDYMTGMKTPSSTVSHLEAHLGYWLRFVSNHVSHAFSRKLFARDVTVAEWVVLRELYERDAVAPSYRRCVRDLRRLLRARRPRESAIEPVGYQKQAHGWIVS